MGNVLNLTEWEYPEHVHQELCDLLRINPRVFIVPDAIRDLFADHLGEPDMNETEAFSDEYNNIVYFYSPLWSPEYRMWLIFHEMFHSRQYFDHGNAAGERWQSLTAPQMEVAWEKEANEFADTYSGSGKLDKDFKRYVKPETKKKPEPKPRRKTKK
jgi:hypothetical protein